MTPVLIRRVAENHVMMKTEIEMIRPQAKECQRLRATPRKPGRDDGKSSSGAFKEIVTLLTP